MQSTGKDRNAPFPIVPLPLEEGSSKSPYRRSVTAWFKDAQNLGGEAALQVSLFVDAMTKFQSLEPQDQLSYFRIAGIHSFPRNVPWNMCMDPIPRNDPDLEKLIEEHKGGDYCAHNMVLFPTWHRIYMMLFERVVSNLMAAEAGKRREADGREAWSTAASRWRLPYWDWAAEPCLPELVVKPKLEVVASWDHVSNQPRMKTVDNPMYRFQMPGNKPMGDSSLGDYRIDSDGAGPWDICIGTDRHSISVYDEKRLWVQGHTDAAKTDSALQGPEWSQAQAGTSPSLKDAVFRMLTSSYSTTYEHFATTRHKKSDPPPPKGYLSLEGVHNTVHDCIGGSYAGALSGSGHMAYVPVAAFDPIFWLHHCNIDRLLFLWQCANPKGWITQTDADDNVKTGLRPFHRTDKLGDFFNSEQARYTNELHYSYDDMDQISNADGSVSKEKLNQHINTLYGPGDEAFAHPTRDVDPIINIIYDRNALDGLQYTVHFFLGRMVPNVPYVLQKSLVGSVYTFTSPLSLNGGGGSCGNCRQQGDDDDVRSRAQIPLTRVVPLDERATHADALRYLERWLRWVVVLDSGVKLPAKALGRTFELELLLGENLLPSALAGTPLWSDYQLKTDESWWKGKEL